MCRLRHRTQETAVGAQDVGHRGDGGHLEVADVERRGLRLNALGLTGLLLTWLLLFGLLLGLLVFGAAVVAAVHLGVVHCRLGEELRLEVLPASPWGFAALGLLLAVGRRRGLAVKDAIDKVACVKVDGFQA